MNESVPLLRDPLQRTAEERCPRSLAGFGDSPAQTDGYGTGSRPSPKEPSSYCEPSWWVMCTLAIAVALLLLWLALRQGRAPIKEVNMHLSLLSQAFLHRVS
ncbi:unnamed protein product [Durusdinium trenchii]|uniref:Uncharacterized protein n=1 Tax=Durusdinium trenchii TaxID=1381693 RepID=A0ABP0SGB7_9DINO|eukprot:g21354.t1